MVTTVMARVYTSSVATRTRTAVVMVAIVAMITAISVVAAVAVVATVVTRMARVGMTTMACHTAYVGGRTMSVEGGGSVMSTVVPKSTMPSAVDGRTAIVIVGAVVAIPKGEVPCVMTTNDGTIEIVGCTIEAVLPVEEDVAQVGVAIIPIVVVGIACTHIEEVLEIDLIDEIVLVGGEVKLISHLVSEIISVLLRFAEAHTKRREEARDGDEERKNVTLHDFYVFR